METKFKNIEFNKYSIFGLILFSFFIFLIFSCNEKMPAPIKIKTAEVENISYYSAIAGGIFEDIDNQIIDEKGICYSTNDIPTIKDNKVLANNKTAKSNNYSIELTKLTPDTKYYLRAYAINSLGVFYGEIINFTTLKLGLANITTKEATMINYTSAMVCTSILDDGGSAITAKGVCWSSTPNPTIENNKTNNGSGSENFESELTGLTQNKRYYVRSYAINNEACAYGNQISFFTCNCETFTDPRDGNIYKLTLIGNFCWMAENLKYLPSVMSSNIVSTTKQYFYVYAYEGTDVNEAKSTENYATYGVLYNREAAMNGVVNFSDNQSVVQGACPEGWHVPIVDEWIYLTNYLGNNTGGKLKEEGTANWDYPNQDATNETGFTALPGGYLHCNGESEYINQIGFWWSASEYIPNCLAHFELHYDSNKLYQNTSQYRSLAMSVRCIKD